MLRDWEQQWSAEEVGKAIQNLRLHRFWSKARLARAARLNEDQIDRYEKGLVLASRSIVERIAKAVDVPFERVERHLLPLMRPLRAALEGPDPGEGLLAELESPLIRVSWAFYRMLKAGALRLLVQAGVLEGAGPVPVSCQTISAEDRQAVAALWEELQVIPVQERRCAVETREKFWHWALCERCCLESVEAAADDADQAVEWAAVAVAIAARIPGGEKLRQRVFAFATFHRGNAYRVHGELQPADEDVFCARPLWRASAAADPEGLLSPARVLGLEASLRMAQRRLGEARALLDEALAIDRGELRPHLLLKKAKILEEQGDYAPARATLAEVGPLLTAESPTRWIWAWRFNVANILCHLERFTEAADLLPDIRVLAAKLGNQLDGLHLHWLEGKVDAGLGRIAEALEHFEAARQGFTRREIPYDAALVALEIAAVHLEEGRTGEVKRLAQEMAPIFAAQQVHREAQAALELFRQAAAQEAATAELVHRLVAYLYRARHDPEMRFAELAG